MIDGLPVQAAQIGVEEDLSDVVSDECDLIDRFTILDRRGELGEGDTRFLSLGRNGENGRQMDQEHSERRQADGDQEQVRETALSNENTEIRHITPPRES